MAGALKENEECRIYVDAPLGPRSSSRWPKDYKAVFRHIHQLGKAELQHYQEGLGADSLYKPWKEQTLYRAKQIVKLAKRRNRTLEHGKQDWDEAERVILARFSIEVACRKCRARLWRSEAETQTPGGEVENRKPCPGGHFGLGEHSHEFCTQSLFDDRAEDAIASPDANEPVFQNREVQRSPYRIYGFRRTEELGRLSVRAPERWQFDATESTSGMVGGSGSVADAESVLFPFLIVEDVSETEANGDINTRIQTACAIRRLLGLQNGLQAAITNGADWDVPPLVWLMSRRAERWDLHAAYIGTNRNTRTYRMFRVWRGGLDSAENAFQLLLHIDYIIDWAREIYREDIIRTLKLLEKAATQTAQASSANDLAVTADNGEPDLAFSPANDVNSAKTGTSDTGVRRRDADLSITKDNTKCRREGQERGAEDALRAFDGPHGVIRDARYIRSRFIGLYVTEDNFGVLMRSTASPDESKKLASNILNCLKEAWRVRRDGLDMVEAIWTDTDRLGWDAYPADKAFLVVFTAVAYLTPDWEQTREMGYLAVAETLLESLLEVAGQHRFPREAAFGAPFMPTDSLDYPFITLFRSTAEHNLTACSARACWESGICPTKGGGRGSNLDKDDELMWRLFCTEERGNELIHRLDVVLKPPQAPRARNLVFDLYRRHKVGRNEPSSSLFRISDYLDVLGPPEQLGELRWVTTRDSSWPVKVDFPDAEQAFALVMPAEGTKFPGQADFCIFAMNPAAAQAVVEPDILLQSKPDWHFQTRRFDRMSAREGRAWNSPGFVSDDQEAVAPKLAAYVQHLREAEAQREPNPSTETEPLQFWRPAKPGRQMYATTLNNRTFHVLDAHRLAENLPHRVRLTSVSWKKPAGRHLWIHEDDVQIREDGSYFWSNPKGPAEPNQGCSTTSAAARSRLRAGGRTALVDLTTEDEDRASEPLTTGVAAAMNGADDAGAGPSSRSRGKRRAESREPGSEAGPSSWKRSRFSAAENNASGEASSSSAPRGGQGHLFERQDWVTDEDFETLLQKGIFS